MHTCDPTTREGLNIAGLRGLKEAVWRRAAVNTDFRKVPTHANQHDSLPRLKFSFFFPSDSVACAEPARPSVSLEFWNASARQSVSTWANPHKALGTESLVSFPGRQLFTCVVIMHCERNYPCLMSPEEDRPLGSMCLLCSVVLLLPPLPFAHSASDPLAVAGPSWEHACPLRPVKPPGDHLRDPWHGLVSLHSLSEHCKGLMRPF